MKFCSFFSLTDRDGNEFVSTELRWCRTHASVSVLNGSFLASSTGWTPGLSLIIIRNLRLVRLLFQRCRDTPVTSHPPAKYSNTSTPVLQGTLPAVVRSFSECQTHANDNKINIGGLLLWKSSESLE